MAFNPKDLSSYKDFLDTQNKISQQMSKSTKDFAVGAKDAVKAFAELQISKAKLNKLEKEEIKLQKQLVGLQGEELRLAQQKLLLLQKEKKEVQKIVQENQALSSALSSQVGSVKNIGLALGRDVLSGMGKVLSKAKELGKEFSESDDTMRRTAINVGLMGKQFNTLRKNAYKAALVTQRIGVSAKELVESYGTYADEVGRLIPLSVKSGKALAYMSKGTSLGSQGAAQMAASMEVFGMSIESSADYVGDVVNMSEKMGVNSGKTLKILQSNLRKAQTVRFKGGVAGMAKMAAKSAKIRMDMGTALGFAQDLWEPEKAIETAASLQMMGGSFAKMGDPIRLMFLGRNNPAKLMEELSEAASSVVTNMGNGTYDIPTMELQKLKQIAEATNVPFEDLVETAKTVAKQKDIGKMLNPNISKDAKDFISSIATYSKEKGGFVVDVGDKQVKISELGAQQAKDMLKQSVTLKDRADQAQGFMSKMENLWKSLKNLGMSFFAGLDETLGPMLRALTGTGEGTLASASDKFFEAGKTFGTWVGKTLVPFIQESIPYFIQAAKTLATKLYDGLMIAGKWIESSLVPSIKAFGAMIMVGWEKAKPILGILVDAAKMIWKGITWVYNGLEKMFGKPGAVVAMLLLVAFPSAFIAAGAAVARMIGMAMMSGGRPGPGGGGGGGNMLGGKGRGNIKANRFKGDGKGRLQKGQKWGQKGFSGGSNVAKGGKGLMGKLGKLGPKMGKMMGPLALVGIGADIGRMFMDDPDTTMGKTLGVLGTTASDAAMGAMVGSMLGPMGTAVGGILGGIVGFGRSMYKEINTKGKSDYDMASSKANVSNTKMVMGGSSFMADGAVMPNGNVIKTAKGKMYSLAPKDVVSIGQPGGGGGGNASGNINVNISGELKLSSGSGSSVSLDGLLKDPLFKAEITRVVIAGMKDQNQ